MLEPSRRCGRPTYALIAMLWICGASALAADQTGTSAHSTCRVIRGSIVPECNGGICIQGKLTGDLSGRFTSKVTSIYPGGSGWVFTSWTHVDLDKNRGRIETLNQGTTPFDAKGGPDLSKSTEVLSISEATGAFQDGTGMLVISGGHEVGQPVTYTGQLCQPIAR